MRDRIRTALRDHPFAADAGLAVVVALATLGGGMGNRQVGWVWIVSLCLPLAFRRKAPVTAFWIAYVVMTAAFVTGVPGVFPLIAVLVAIYAVARYRGPGHVWFAAGAIGSLLVAAWLQGHLALSDLMALTTALAATVLLAATVRTRRAYLSRLEERALSLERERDQQAELAAAAERARIARELHDIVAHNLAVMVALSDGAAFTATLDPPRAAETMAEVSGTGREALAEMRRLLSLMRDGTSPAAPDAASLPGLTFRTGAELSPQPGLSDLDPLFYQVRAAGVELTDIRDGVPGRWHPGASLAIYRIVQEALTNTIKHAGPGVTAYVRLRYTSTGADVEVVDDGGGRDISAVDHMTGGHGLGGMRERVAAYDGRLDTGPRPGGGWRVHARLHIEEKEDDDHPAAPGGRPADAQARVPHGVRDPA